MPTDTLTNPPAVCPKCGSPIEKGYSALMSCGSVFAHGVQFGDESDLCKARQEISLLTAKLAALEAEARWIPVGERLPEAGLPVIAFVQREGWRRRIRAYYAPPKSIEGSDNDNCSEYDEEKDCFWLPSGWYEDNEYEETNWHVDDPVTHWRPLPEGPKEDLK